MSERHDQFWAEFFGIAATDLRTPGRSVVEHVGLAGYRGAWFFLRGARLVVSAPASWLERIRRLLVRHELPTHPVLRKLFGSSLGRAIGPAFQGALAPRDFRPFTSTRVQALTEAHSEAIARFKVVCDPDDWNDSALDAAKLFRAGYFDDGRLVAMAGFRPKTAVAGDPCVLTVRDCRGRGCAKAVVSSVLADAIAHDHLPLYQTLEANVAAVRIALALGYDRYANHIAVRLTTDEPSAA